MNIDISQNYNDLFRQLLFIIVLVVIGVILFDQLSFFLGSILGAITLYFIFRGVQFRMVEVYKWPKWLVALLITVFSCILLSFMGWGMTKIISSELPSIDTGKFLKETTLLTDDVNSFIGFDLLTPSRLMGSGDIMTKLVTRIVNMTYSFVANIVLMLVILYFMLSSGRKMESKVSVYAPFCGHSLELLKGEIKNMIYSNAVGIPVIMVCQTVVSSLLYYIIGLESYLFWGFMTAMCGLVPLLGTALVYVPMGLYYISMDNWGIGIFVILYGLLIISNIDNLIRILILGKYAHTHPLIVIFGVIAGLPLFGFWGIIFGPLFISGFLLLIKIYMVEYGLLPSDHPEVECVCGSRRKKSFRELALERAIRRKSRASQGESSDNGASSSR